MSGREFQCANCKGEFEIEWSEEEALTEMKQNGFDKFPMSEMRQVCDDCYKKIMRFINN